MMFPSPKMLSVLWIWLSCFGWVNTRKWKLAFLAERENTGTPMWELPWIWSIVKVKAIYLVYAFD